MTDSLTPAQRSERMGRVKGRDTKPELQVRRLLTELGYRYRLQRKDLPGKPDIAFLGRRKVIFVHGCFWHRHPDPTCPLARLPKSRLDFWLPKLEANRARDLRTQSDLTALGWRFHIVWECEIKDGERLKTTLRRFLEDPCGA
ncbi:MAG: DNA mismatch endonuclease Vsr [Rhodospirillum sp.]|nr:DNA mismatch endonuclease Vsr [Rhodospirillum sp.]MCF8489290.1 DNA mismatch endonuclease Vsr [Rhodospirillum sp.]MCF8502011.1 DNA mismatch endonuclease Vsr [Rhodospirillum sp.]